MKTTVVLVMVIIVLILGPLLALWAMNTISDQSDMGWYIPHNVWTYLSIYALSAVFKGASK